MACGIYGIMESLRPQGIREGGYGARRGSRPGPFGKLERAARGSRTWPDRGTTGELLLLFFDLDHHGLAVEGTERLDDRRHAGVRRAGHHDLHPIDGADELDRGV